MAEDIILRVSLDGADDQLNKLTKLQQEIKRLADQKKALNNQEKTLTAEIRKNGQATDAQTIQLKELTAQQIENGAALKANRATYREQERQIINTTKAQQLNKGSLVELRAQLSKDTFAYDRLTKAERDNEAIGGKLRQSIKRQSDALKQLEGQTGRNQRNVGNYTGALNKARGAFNKFLGALGITAGITGLIRVMSGAVKTAKDFEQGNANLAAVLGKSRSEITKLTEDAKRLGQSTAFSASEVSKLQTEFAKLGFNEKEILNATEATLDLAAATGADLAEAAAIAGATLGGFGLDAEETQRVTDVMAKSFSTSALDIEKFKESMKVAAPAARAVGVDVEETTALLGALANAGVSGSMAGTALRKSFIELNAAGLTLDEGLAKVRDSEDQLGAATDLVGKKAASSFLILANGTDEIKSLEAGLNNAGGAAKKMADEQLNTLEGQTKILNSAWEGLVLSLMSGDSLFNSMAKSIVEGATGMLTFFTNTKKASEALEEERVNLFAVQSQLFDTNTTQEDRVKLITDLQDKYPKYLKNINAETVSNEDLQKALNKVNNELVNKIILQKQDEKRQEQLEKVSDAAIKKGEAEVALRTKLAKITANNAKAQEAANNANGTLIEQTEAVIEALGGVQAVVGGGGGFGGAAMTASIPLANELSNSLAAISIRQAALTEEQEKANSIDTERAALLKTLGISTDEVTELTEDGTEANEDGTEGANELTKATNSLIDAQKKLKEEAEKLPETTEAEIAAKNAKIEVIDKEIKRLNDLGKTQKENTKSADKLAKEALDKKKKEVDDRIKLLQVEHDLELAQKDLTDEEKLAKEAVFLDKLGALRIEKAKLNNDNLTIVEKENELAKAEALKETTDELNEKELEDEKVKETFKQEIRQQTEDLAVQGGKALVQAAGERAQREKDIELANLNAKLEAGTISQEQFEKERVEIERKAFQNKKKRDLAVIAIDLAKELSAISAAAAANPANAVTFGVAGVTQAAALSALAVARSGIQAGIIASQKFAQGGVIHGASHAQGGVNVAVGGSGMIEAEGGEAIINKRSTAKHLGLLSAINQDGGGVPLAERGMVTPNYGTLRKFGNGGIATSPAAQSQTIDLDGLETRIAEAVGSIKVQNVASETTGVANRVQQIEDSASF